MISPGWSPRTKIGMNQMELKWQQGATEFMVWTKLRSRCSVWPITELSLFGAPQISSSACSVCPIPELGLFSLTHTRFLISLVWLIPNCRSVRPGPYPKFRLVHPYFWRDHEKNFPPVNLFGEVKMKKEISSQQRQTNYLDWSKTRKLPQCCSQSSPTKKNGYIQLLMNVQSNSINLKGINK